MGYGIPDPYYQPEKFGLTMVKEINEGCGYDFDITAVWAHEDGRWFVANDFGCSCPSPFEDFDSLDDLTEVKSVGDVVQFCRDNLTSELRIGELVSGLVIP